MFRKQKNKENDWMVNVSIIYIIADISSAGYFGQVLNFSTFWLVMGIIGSTNRIKTKEKLTVHRLEPEKY